MSILLEQVSKRFDGQAAVADVSVSIEDREFFVLLGPSGSGKSTLLRAIAGLTSIDHGRILLHGREVTNLNARDREVGFVFQNYALFRHMTVADNIEFALRARRVRAAERRRRRGELLELVALTGYDDRMPGELSGGQQQRVAVARALAHEPRVLLLDEPFGALDARIRDELRRAIREIQRRVGITTILVTHDQEEAFTMADRIGVMDRGRLQEVGEPRRLYAEPKTRFVATFLGSANLLLGESREDGVHVAQSCFPTGLQPIVLDRATEVTVVVRPEDVVIARDSGRGRAPYALGAATVSRTEFSGALERIHLTVATGETMVSAGRPAASSFVMEATRSAQSSASMPLACGQRVNIGARRIHVLPTMLSSLRTIAGPGGDAEALATSELVADLSERMNVVATRHGPEDIDGRRRLNGLPIVALGGDGPLSAAIGLLQRGAYQALAVNLAARPVERMLIYTQASRPAREGALSVASSLLRHLAVSATIMVPAQERSSHSMTYRELLDLRSAALRVHGVDLQTETFEGPVPDALRERLEEPHSTILLIGLTSIPGGARLMEELSDLATAARPNLSGVLLVCLSPDSEMAASARQRLPAAVHA